jgi:hypothetical protein
MNHKKKHRGDRDGVSTYGQRESGSLVSETNIANEVSLWGGDHFTVIGVSLVVGVAPGEVGIGKFLFQKVSDGHWDWSAYQASSLV